MVGTPPWLLEFFRINLQYLIRTLNANQFIMRTVFQF